MDLGIAGLGLGAVGLFGGIFIIIQKFMGDDNAKDKIHQFKQKQKRKEVKSLRQESNQVKAELDKKQEVSKEQEDKVQKIVDKASKEVEKTLKEDKSIADIQNEMDEDWDNL